MIIKLSSGVVLWSLAAVACPHGSVGLNRFLDPPTRHVHLARNSLRKVVEQHSCQRPGTLS